MASDFNLNFPPTCLNLLEICQAVHVLTLKTDKECRNSEMSTLKNLAFATTGISIGIFASIELGKERVKREETVSQKLPTKKKRRRKRFEEFASVEHNGTFFMTPMDFLQSTVYDRPRPRLKRKVISIVKNSSKGRPSKR